MNNESMINYLIANYTPVKRFTAIWVDLPVSRNITKNASNYRLTETEHDMLILAMIETMRTMEICTVPREAGEKFDQSPLISVGTTTYDLATALSASETPEDVKRFIREFNKALVDGKSALIDLVTVYNVKGNFKIGQIGSYFRSIKSSFTVNSEDMEIRINLFSTYLPNFVETEDGRKMLTKNDWMERGLTYSSTATLIKRAMQITDEKQVNFYGDHEREIVQASYDSLWSSELNGLINHKTIAKAYVTLEYYDLLPKNTWFQGEKAMKQCSYSMPIDIRFLLKSLEKIIDEKSKKNLNKNFNFLTLFFIILYILFLTLFHFIFFILHILFIYIQFSCYFIFFIYSYFAGLNLYPGITKHEMA
jgi:hypothetical protein